MVFVDALVKRSRTPIPGQFYWCHCWTDGDIEELHAFAERIGLPRSWFQPHISLNHYDLTPGKRALALRSGAVEADLREWILAHKPECSEARLIAADRRKWALVR